MFSQAVSVRRALRILILAAAAAALASGGQADAGHLFRPARPPASCPARQAPPAEPAPEDAVRQVLDAQVAAWNRGDLDAFMAGYWQSPELTFFSGPDRTSGWQATLERYRKRYQSEGKEMGRLTFSDVNVEMLGPDAALVRGGWRVEQSKETLGGLFTLIFRRTLDGWRIVHDHTSR
jgi:beta-aspartyl-peptidase (threonine type)